jgi:transposase
MKYYAGLDVSMKETFVCVIDQSGKRLCEKSISTEPKAIFSYLNGLKLEIELVGLESGALSHWLTTELKNLGLRVKCIDARHIAAVLSVKINKTDKNDARGIADAMRCGLYKEVKAKEKEVIALSTLLNGRKMLVDQRTQLLSCIRGLLKPFGIRLGTIGKSLKSIEVILKALKEVPETVVSTMHELIKVLVANMASTKELDKKVQEKLRANKEAQLLISIPGVGPITSLRFIADICEPSRFSKSKSVGAYVGLTPRQYSSGETQKQGKISKCGPKELRTLLMEAGVVILTRTKSWSKLKAWGLRIQKKHGLKKAATAVGRKLAVIMHRMMLTGEQFKFTDKEELKKAA